MQRKLTRRELSMARRGPCAAGFVRREQNPIHQVRDLPTRIPMVDRVREAWIASYKLQGTFQTHYNPVFVRLYTDEGIVGTGESLAAVPQTENILKRLIGKSPIEFWQDDSIQGVLIAVQDVLGQASGMPISRILSPTPKTRVEHTWWRHCLPPDLMASEAKLAASLGYRVHKVKARPWQDPLEQAAAMCAVVPKEYRIWADANANWGSPTEHCTSSMGYRATTITLLSNRPFSTGTSMLFVR